MAESFEHLPLFETKSGKGLVPSRLFVGSILACICSVFVYRVSNIPTGLVETDLGVRWTAWIGLFLAELWFSFCWLLNLVVRWKPIVRITHKHRLSQRYVCIAYIIFTVSLISLTVCACMKRMQVREGFAGH